MNTSPDLYPLKGVVQNYAWGGAEYIPGLLNIDNPAQKPFAEYWLGAHSNHPAHTADEQDLALDQLIGIQGEHILGKTVHAQFSLLPYLFKVLDVQKMLSIQVHPGKEAAEQAFLKENEMGIPVNAPNRNYKDNNHKPELMVALSDFYLLHGFKNEKLLLETLNATPELKFLIPEFNSGGYKKLYEIVMLMPQEKVNSMLQPLVDRILPLYQNGTLQKNTADFWAARAVKTFCTNGQLDRGIFSIYFFNLLLIQKGGGIYQPAGMPHAYLEGQNVEVMANSDNVLRAGLTDKHIDVSELLKHVKFEATEPNILQPPPAAGHRVFKSPAREFELHQYILDQHSETGIQAATAEIFLVLEGELMVSAGNVEMAFQKGAAFLLRSGASCKLHTNAKTEVFRVTVPQP